MTVESSMPHKTSTSSVVKNAGGKAAGGKAATMIQTWIVNFVYHYLYRDIFIAFLKSSWSARNLSEPLV